METHVTITQDAAPAYYKEPPASVRLTRGKADPVGRVVGSPCPGETTHGGNAMGVHHGKTRRLI